MASSDLSVLIDMGFEPARAELAVKKSGGRTCTFKPPSNLCLRYTVQGAIDWLEKVQDQSTEELTAQPSSTTAEANEDNPTDEPPALKAGEVARSLVCSDCNKKFRSQAQAEFHASKSGHENFAESTEDIAPLTEEEKKQKLAELREKMREKREKISVQDKADQKRNEQIRMKSTKETQDIKEELAKKEQIKEAAAKRREKAADKEAKEKIKAKIAADKEERRVKAEREKAEREGRAAAVSSSSGVTPSPSGQVTSKPASAYTETRMRFQTSKGNVMKTFPVNTTLFEVAQALSEEKGIEVQKFEQGFPKKVFDDVDFGSTLKELGLVPSASLIVR